MSANAGGVLALSLALKRLGWTEDPVWMDDVVRGWGPGTSAAGLIEAARSRNFQAELYNHGTFEQLSEAMGRGWSVMTMADLGGWGDDGVLDPGNPLDLELQWVSLSNAWVDQNGQRWVELMNPAGTVDVLKYERFDAMWRRLHLSGLPMGYDRAFVLVGTAQGGPLPESTAHDVSGITDVAQGANEVGRAAAGQGLGLFFSGVGRMVSALPRAADDFARALLGVSR